MADALRARIVLSDIVKDGLTYKNAFDRRQTVDKIAYIIKTTDRNLALLLGGALDAQKYFHAPTYDNRLRDSLSEIRSTRVNPHRHQARLLARRVRVPRILMHAVVRLTTKHRQSWIQGNIQIRPPSLVLLGQS